MIRILKKSFIATLLFAFLLPAGSEALTGAQLDMSLRMGESRQTKSPLAYSNALIRKAYGIAKRIPWVLDSIYCYCYCEESPIFRHKSLLSCYVDDHAAQ